MAHSATSFPPPRCVPWASWSQFLTVHQCVEDMVAAPGACARPAANAAAIIAAWRTHSSLPLAVDCTGQIAEHYANDVAVRGGVCVVLCACLRAGKGNWVGGRRWPLFLWPPPADALFE